MKQWYALHTKPNNETQVAMVLQALGIETYLPEVMVFDERHGRHSKPFFPNYLFAKVDFEQVGLSQVRWTPGLRAIVAVDGYPVSVPDDIIAMIGWKLREFQTIDGMRAHTFQPGDTVRIVSGPFQDMLAVFDRATSSATRVRVLLNVLGRANKVCVPVSALEKAPYTDGVPKEKRPRRTRGRGRRIKNYAGN